MKRNYFLFLLSFLFLNNVCGATELVVLTDRSTDRLDIVKKRYKEVTGDNLKIIEGSYEKLKESHLESTPQGDVVLFKDLYYFADLQSRSLLEKLLNQDLYLEVQPALRDTKGEWIPVSYRTRTLIYNPDLDPREIEKVLSYEDLSDSSWEGRLCLRTSAHTYNYSLGAYLIETLGLEKAKETLFSWVNNTQKIYPNDKSIILAIANGECDLGVVNHYYLAQALAEDPRLPVSIRFLNQNQGGSHTNGTLVGILKASQQKQKAQAFINILFENEIQTKWAQSHFDYPAKAQLLANHLPKQWQDFKMSDTPWNQIMDSLYLVKDLFESVSYK